MGGMKTEVRERLARYLAELNGLEEKLDGFEELTEALGALQAESDALYALRDSEYVPMTRQDYTEIAELYRNALNACEHYLEGSPAELPEDAPAKAVRELLKRDMQLLSGLSFTSGGKTLSLPEAVEKARGYSVDVTGMALNTKGGAQSTRIALEIISESGRSMQGFFTETGVIDPLKQYGAVFRDYCMKLTAVKPDLLRGGVSGAQAVNELAYALGLDVYGEIHSEEALDAMRNTLRLTKRDPNGNTDIDPNAATPELLIALDAAKQAEPALYRELMDGLRGVDIQRSLMGRTLGVKNGSNIERRNMGMSIVANLLGRPELVAASVPMTVLNGKETKTGIFMESAEGTELGSIPFDHPIRDKTVRDAISPEGLESMAGLQILDYICQNIDRHRGNLFYRFNEQGQISGVQGIDNDTSFGVKAMRSDRKTAVLAALDDLMVIPESLARALNGLTKEMLQTNLRGVVTDQEISAAWQRVEDIQERISLGRTLSAQDTPEKLHLETGKLRTVKPEEWARMDAARLCNRPVLDRTGVLLSDEKHDWTREAEAVNEKPRSHPDEFTNIFDIALSIPYQLRHADRQRYEQYEDRAIRRRNGEDPMDELAANMAERDSSRLARKSAIFAQTRAVSGLKAVPVAGDEETIRGYIGRLERSGGAFLEGREKYKLMKAQLQSFPKLAALEKKDAPAYLAQLRALKTAAQTYLNYKLEKGEPEDNRTFERVRTVREIVEFAEKRERQVTEALTAETRDADERKEREVAGTLAAVRGMAGYIDELETRSNAAEQEEPKLAELGRTAMKALNGLIDYSTQEKPAAAQQAQMKHDLAAVMLFEIASSARVQNPEGYEQMKNQPGGWERMLQKIAGSDSFAMMTEKLTPERVSRLASDAASIRAFTARYTEAQRIRDKGTEYRNAGLEREMQPKRPGI